MCIVQPQEVTFLGLSGPLRLLASTALKSLRNFPKTLINRPVLVRC